MRRIRLCRLSVYIEPRDLWVGVYVAQHAVYVCPLPLLVIKWERRTRFARGGLVRPMGGSVMAGRDSVVAKLSEGRSTTRRPGETWAQAMNRLTEGEDL